MNSEIVISALYGRVSDEESADKENGSLEQQKHICFELAKAKTITTGKKHVMRHVLVEEDAVSGGTDQRPQYQKLISLIKQQKVQAVFAKSVSRLSRSTLHFCEFMDLCFENSVALYIQEIDIDPNSAMGAALFKLLAVVAELEREQIRSRTRSSIRSRMKNNRKINGGNVILGFDKDPTTTGVWIPNKTELEIVEFLMNTFNQTLSLIETCRKANKLGFKTKAGSQFRPDYLKRTFTNIKYVGKLAIPTCTVDRKKYPRIEDAPNYTPPIVVDLPYGSVISPDLFQQVQLSLEKMSSLSKARKGNRAFPFSNILEHEDGSKFVGWSGTSHTGRLYFYYKNCKHNIKINAEEFEEAALKSIESIYETDEELARQVKSVVSSKANRLSLIQGNIDKLTAEINAITRKEDSLAEKLTEFEGANLKILSWLEKNLSDILAEKEEKREQVLALKFEYESLEKTSISTKSLRSVTSSFFSKLKTMDLEVLRGVYRQICHKLIYKPCGTVEIKWCFDLVPSLCDPGVRGFELGTKWGGISDLNRWMPESQSGALTPSPMPPYSSE